MGKGWERNHGNVRIGYSGLNIRGYQFRLCDPLAKFSLKGDAAYGLMRR
jgi:hypothetical protein